MLVYTPKEDPSQLQGMVAVLKSNLSIETQANSQSRVEEEWSKHQATIQWF